LMEEHELGLILPRAGVSQRATRNAVKRAVQQARVPKAASCHTFRHSFARHLLESGYDIRTVLQPTAQSNHLFGGACHPTGASGGAGRYDRGEGGQQKETNMKQNETKMSLDKTSQPDRPGLDELVPSRYAVQVGEIDVLVVSDGVLPIPAPIIATNVDSAVRTAWLNDMFLSPEMLDWPLNVVVVRSGGQ